MRDDSNYLDALSEVAAQSKSSITISSVPLGLILVQLRYLTQVDSFWLQLFATIAVSALFIGTLIAWYLAMIVQSTYAFELFRRDGKVSEKGQIYVSWILSLSKGRDLYNEEYVVRVSSILVGPFWLLTAFGYFSLMIFMLALIWQTPA